jgi:hypothetical protein
MIVTASPGSQSTSEFAMTCLLASSVCHAPKWVVELTKAGGGIACQQTQPRSCHRPTQCLGRLEHIAWPGTPEQRSASQVSGP